MRAWYLLPLLLATAGCSTAGFNRLVQAPPPPMESLASGVRYQELLVGTGALAVPGALVTVHYIGQLENGKQFDSSYDSGVPLTFTLGAHEVIRGWEEGLLGMRVGGKRRLHVPAELAYGKEGRAGVIPPNTALVLEVELLDLFGP
jgi:FKBP-type peptidyl-prolyl cis-trans isomerase FkpA